MDTWLQDKGCGRGAALPLDQAWNLARAWYGDRLAPEFAGRSTSEVRSIFSELGLTGPFWASA